MRTSLPILAIALLTCLAACKEVTPPAAAPDAEVAAPGDPFEPLRGGQWIGVHDGREPIVLEFVDGPDGLAARLTFTIFGEASVVEELDVTLEPTGTVRLVGTSYEAKRGLDAFTLDKMEASLSEDGRTLSGTNHPEGFPAPLSWSVSRDTTLAEVDPPLQPETAAARMIAARYERLRGGAARPSGLPAEGRRPHRDGHDR